MTRMTATGKATFSPDDVIFEEGSAGHFAYIVLAGDVQITRKGPQGPIHLSTIGQHGIFGEMALLDDSPRSATATAKNDVTCLVIDRDKFDASLNRAEPLIRGMLRILASNLRATSERLVGEACSPGNLSEEIADLTK